MFAITFHPGAVLSVLTFGLLIVWIFWRWSRQSEDPPMVLALKIILSCTLIAGAVYSVLAFHPIVGVPLAAVCGILTGILWGRNIGAAIARPLSSLYDGGDEAPEPVPFYAIAEAHRKQARYAEAVAEVRRQLERFPGDLKGLLLLAEIEARHRGDWEAALAAIEEIVAQGELPAAPRAKALQALADWHLELRHDTETARALLERVGSLFPGTAEARDARQRIDHLGDDAWRRERQAPSKLRVTVSDRRIGLESPGAPQGAADETPGERVERLVRWLADHPNDTEAREQLGSAYAELDGLPDRGVAQLEWLILQPNATPRQLEAWYHKMADLRVRYGGDAEGARDALQRLMEAVPGTAVSAKAQSRLDHLKLEVRGRSKPAAPIRGGDPSQARSPESGAGDPAPRT